MKNIVASKKGPRLDGTLHSNPRINRLLVRFRRDWQLHLLMLLPILYKLIFDYVPMYGVQIAFRAYTLKGGLTGSEWVGLKWFERFVSNYEFLEIVGNTVILALYSILAGFPLPVFFALMLNAMRHERYKKVVQSVAYMPHFISTVVIVSIVNMVFSPVNGIYGSLFRLFGGEGFPSDFRHLPQTFRHMYVWSGIWQSLGWSTIIYTAALAGVSQELHEAAMIDGATRWQRVLHVDLPSILPSVCIMLIMRFGSIMSIGFEKVYLMQSSLNGDVSEVISTYVFKKGMSSLKNFSFGSAVGLFNSIINAAMLLLVNWITNKLSQGESGLF